MKKHQEEKKMSKWDMVHKLEKRLFWRYICNCICRWLITFAAIAGVVTGAYHYFWFKTDSDVAYFVFGWMTFIIMFPIMPMICFTMGECSRERKENKRYMKNVRKHVIQHSGEDVDLIKELESMIDI